MFIVVRLLSCTLFKRSRRRLIIMASCPRRVENTEICDRRRLSRVTPIRERLLFGAGNTSER